MLQSKTYVFLLLLLTVVFSFPQKAISATITTQSGQSEINASDEYVVNANLSISTGDGTIYYLRGVFYKTGTSNYCGLTWNGSEWFSGPYTTNDGWKKFLTATISSSSWSGQLKAKIDTNDSSCNSSGAYNFKIQRFTGGGSGTFDSQNEQTVQVNVPAPTPSNSPTPTMGSSSTNTPTPTKIPTSTLTPTKKPTNTPTPKKKEVEVVLGAKTKKSPTPSPDISKNEKEKIAGARSVNPTYVLFILIGIVILMGCGILAWQKFDPLHRKKGFFDEIE